MEKASGFLVLLTACMMALGPAAATTGKSAPVEALSSPFLAFPGALGPSQHGEASYAGVFQAVWQTVNDEFYDPDFAGVDWQGVRRRYQPLLAQVERADPGSAAGSGLVASRAAIAALADHRVQPGKENRIPPRGAL